MAEVRLLKARYLFTGVDRPLAGGIVAIRGERVAEVNPVMPGQAAEDLGNVAILPGLINAHTHLELSDLAQPIGTSGIEFADWIRQLILWRQTGRHSAAEATARGLAESAAHGVTAVADIVQPDWPIAALASVPINVAAFLELIGPTADAVEAQLEFARGHLAMGQTAAVLGLSPHAPHTVHDLLFDGAVQLAVSNRSAVAFHLAESTEELELLRSGTGPLRDLLEERGRWDPRRFNAPRRPLDYLQRLSRAGRALVIHGNYLDDEELMFLGRHRANMAVVYCPRGHAHFDRDPYPLGKMLAAGVRVALGTDSRASAPDLNLLAEMRQAARRHRDVHPAAILGMATLEAARALGLSGDSGSIQPGNLANLTLVALPEVPETDPYTLLLDADTEVLGRWYRGQPDARPN